MRGVPIGLDADALALVQMVTPVTPPRRLALLASESRGFVYAVTMTGTTGKAIVADDELLDYLQRVREVAELARVRRLRDPHANPGRRRSQVTRRLHRRLRPGRGTGQRAGHRRFPARPEGVTAVMQEPRWVVHKFGGSSLADADCLRRVAAIVEALPESRVALVLSACRGVTDELIQLVGVAERADEADARPRSRGCTEGIGHRDGTARSTRALKFIERLQADIADLRRLTHTVALVRSAGRDLHDLAAGFGELWSSRLFAAFLGRPRPTCVGAMDRCAGHRRRRMGRARAQRAVAGIARTDDATHPAGHDETLVLPGFVATDTRGLRTTLGRNGSDFSGSIFGALLRAREIVIWTDVDGVLSADPRQVPDAKVIHSLSYSEAMELAYFGAKVIHPQTMAPAVEQGIPIRIRNTFAPENPGTVIVAAPDSKLAVKGITSIDDVALVNLEGAGMIGVPGTAHRLFGALHDAGISVILISQGSSEHSICFAIPAEQAALAERAVRRAFASELRDGQIQSVEVTRRLLDHRDRRRRDGRRPRHRRQTVLGARQCRHQRAHDCAGRLGAEYFGHRRPHGDREGACARCTPRFYLSPHTLSIGLIGPGTIGSVLIEQLASQLERLRRDFNLDLRVRGIANSKRMLLAERAIDLTRWREELDRHGEPTDLDRFADHVVADHLPHHVMIDCTADCRGRRPLRRLVCGRPARRDAEQEGQQRASRRFPPHAAGASRGGHALSL